MFVNIILFPNVNVLRENVDFMVCWIYSNTGEYKKYKIMVF